MAAGMAATNQTNSDSERPHEANRLLPVQPRPLTRGERSRGQTHVFWSPRNNRIVTLQSTLTAALAMQLEFNSSLYSYVERPRRLEIQKGKNIDISFWTKSKENAERFLLALPDVRNGLAKQSQSNQLSVNELEYAASRAGILVEIVSEAHLRSQSIRLKTYAELLLHVWQYARLSLGTVIRSRIESRFGECPRIALNHLVRTLEFDDGAVRATVAAMIHDGSLTLVEYSPGFTNAVLEVPNA